MHFSKNVQLYGRMNKFRYYASIALLLLIAMPSPVLANDLVASPFFIHNQSPIIQIFGLPPAEGGQITPPGRTKLRLVVDVSNNFTADKSAEESVLFDGETSRITLSFRRGFGDSWEGGIDIPVVSHQGGMLDGLIENWHDTFGLPQGGRDNAPRNRLHYSYQQEGEKEGLNFSNSGTGIGDTSIYLAYQLNRKTTAVRRYIALRGGIKFPSGDTDQLRGSGGTDFHLRLAASDGETLKVYNLTLFASMGALWLGKGEILSDKQHQNVGFGSIGLVWTPLKRFTFKVQIDGHTAFFGDSHLKQIDSPSAQLAIGGTINLSDNLALDLCVVEDIIVDTAPDVTFHAALTYLY